MEGKITKIEAQKKNDKRINVYIEQDFAFACDMELAYKYNIKKDEVINLEKIKAIIDEDNFIKAKFSALKIVERAYKTEKDIREKLIDKGYELNTINRVMDFLKEYDFINDDKYSSMYIKDKIKTQGKSKIKYYLINKGVDINLIEKNMNYFVNGEEEEQGAKVLAEKKLKVLAKRQIDSFKLKQKLYSYMLGRGYDWDCSKKVVDEVFRESFE